MSIRSTVPSIVRLQVTLVRSASVAVQLNIVLLLLVRRPAGGVLRVITGAVLSTNTFLTPDTLLFPALSEHATYQVWRAFAAKSTVQLVDVSFSTDELVWLSNESMYNEQFIGNPSVALNVKVVLVVVWLV